MFECNSNSGCSCGCERQSNGACILTVLFILALVLLSIASALTVLLLTGFILVAAPLVFAAIGTAVVGLIAAIVFVRLLLR